MNYIAELRKKVGKELIMTVGCGVLVENEKAKYFFRKGAIPESGASLEEHLNRARHI